jgi:hypothetical protein
VILLTPLYGPFCEQKEVFHLKNRDPQKATTIRNRRGPPFLLLNDQAGSPLRDGLSVCEQPFQRQNIHRCFLQDHQVRSAIEYIPENWAIVKEKSIKLEILLKKAELLNLIYKY